MVSGKVIRNVHKYMCDDKSLKVSAHVSFKYIDGAILRTYKNIYEETLPTLYGDNQFFSFVARKI